MTDRQLGGEGLNADIKPQTDRRVGAEGLSVDVAPPQTFERQLDYVGIQFDFTYPQGVQFGAFAPQLDLVASAIKQVGSIGLMIDFVGSLVAANAARWSGTAFEMGTASPLVYFGAGAFQSTGTKPVLWVTDHFEVSP